MNKMILLAVMAMFLLSSSVTNTNVRRVSAYNWDDGSSSWGAYGTHGLICREAISLLRTQGYDWLATVAEQYIYDLINGDRNEDVDGGEVPILGMDWNGIHHFVDPMDHNEFVAAYSESAADYAVTKFDEGVSAWRNDHNYNYAFDRLGHALHLIQDICVPPSHTTPHHAIDHMDEHGNYESIAIGVMQDIYYGRVAKPTYDPVYSWDLAAEKALYWTGTDFSEADNENGHITGHPVAWSLVDAAAHYSWTWLPYLFDHGIELDDHLGDATDYFWTRDLSQGDDGTLILKFQGADYIDIDFDEIDMTNIYYDTLGWLRVYDRNWNQVYAEDRDFFAPTVRVYGDTAYIRAYVTEDDWLDDDVDGYEIDELYVSDSISTTGASSMAGYTNIQYASYNLLKKAVELSAGLIRNFFSQVVTTSTYYYGQTTLNAGVDSGWLAGGLATPANSMAMVSSCSWSQSTTDIDFRVWWGGGGGLQTGGWTSWDHNIYYQIPSSTYSGYSARPEWVLVLNPSNSWWFHAYNYYGPATYYYVKVTFLRNI